MLWSTVLKKGTSVPLNPPTTLKITQVVLKDGNGTFRVNATCFDLDKEDDVTTPVAVVSTNKPNCRTELVVADSQEVTLSVEGDCTVVLVGYYVIDDDDEDFLDEEGEDEEDEDLMDSFITDGDGEEMDEEEEEVNAKLAVSEKKQNNKKEYVEPLKDNSTPPPKAAPKANNKQVAPQQPKTQTPPSPQTTSPKKLTLSGGLEVDIVKAGNGKAASRGKKVTVKYTGRLAKNQKVFDSGSISFKLGAGEVIKGWDLGVEGMKIGEKRKLTIPPALGYGNKGAGREIPGNSTLIFDVELLKC